MSDLKSYKLDDVFAGIGEYFDEIQSKVDHDVMWTIQKKYPVGWQSIKRIENEINNCTDQFKYNDLVKRLDKGYRDLITKAGQVQTGTRMEKGTTNPC